eukprot:1156706-Pelagomonas_calceolata.AAC.8
MTPPAPASKARDSAARAEVQACWGRCMGSWIGTTVVRLGSMCVPHCSCGSFIYLGWRKGGWEVKNSQLCNKSIRVVLLDECRASTTSHILVSGAQENRNS